MSDSPNQTLEQAERRLFEKHGIPYERRRIALRDPALEVAVREAGDGEPLLLVHGSGMSGATWAPMMEHLRDRRVIAVDLPGFAFSDEHSYSGRPLKQHAVAQLTSILDALDLRRVDVAGTSLGAMWVLCLARHKPERVGRVAALGVPAVSLPGMEGDPYFTLMTTPFVRRAIVKMPAPRSAKQVRSSMRKVLGDRATAAASDEWCEVVRATMAMPGWRTAMYTHLNLAMRRGKPRPENHIGDDDLRRIEAPVEFIWADGDVYGPPSIGKRAAQVMPDARVHTFPGGHAPFIDEPQECARIIQTDRP